MIPSYREIKDAKIFKLSQKVTAKASIFADNNNAFYLHPIINMSQRCIFVVVYYYNNNNNNNYFI